LLLLSLLLWLSLSSVVVFFVSGALDPPIVKMVAASA